MNEISFKLEMENPDARWLDIILKVGNDILKAKRLYSQHPANINQESAAQDFDSMARITVAFLQSYIRYLLAKGPKDNYDAFLRLFVRSNNDLLFVALGLDL
nr:hypothetical transcript [Hymenolepis microstoma]